MCLAVPALIKAIDGPNAWVDLGVERVVSLLFTPEARQGDYVLVHTGFAIGVVDEAEAQATLRLLREWVEMRHSRFRGAFAFTFPFGYNSPMRTGTLCSQGCFAYKKKPNEMPYHQVTKTQRKRKETLCLRDFVVNAFAECTRIFGKGTHHIERVKAPCMNSL